MKTGYFTIILLLIYNVLPNIQSYTCQTPTEWLQLGDISAFYGINGLTSSNATGRKWPNGVVKYHLNSSLTEQDKKEVLQAFEEFHSKTCIRFEAVDDGVSLNQQDYVSIEVDESVCGMAHVCMQGGYQFAKFGQNCRKKNTMIHQLGHTICLSHEEQGRYKGDEATLSKKCFEPFKRSRTLHKEPDAFDGLWSGERQKELQENHVKRIYDQASQMHTGCNSDNPSTKKCGQQITSGLSVLDADYINAMYNCQGCYRHRWITYEPQTPPDKSQLYSFGSYDLGTFSHDLYPCRAYLNGEVSIGKFNFYHGACYIGFSDKEYKLCENFEVLTIPSGDRSNLADTEYLLIYGYHGQGKKERENLYANAIAAGSLSWGDGTGPGNGYVAFGTIANFGRNCGDEEVWWSGGANRKVGAIGRAWRYENRTEAIATTCGREFPLKMFYILGCKRKENKTEEGQVGNISFEYSEEEEKAETEKVGGADKSSMKLEGSSSTTEESSHFLSGFFTGFIVLTVLFVAAGLVYIKLIKKSTFGMGRFRYTRQDMDEEQF